MEDLSDVLENLDAIREIPDETYKKLLDNAFASLLGKPEIHNTSALLGSKPDLVKKTYATILSIIASTAQKGLQNIDETIKEKLPQLKRDHLQTLYTKNYERLTIRFARLGLPTAPHIVDCKWRLEHLIKTSELDDTCGPVYRVELVTDSYDEEIDGCRSKKVEFTCNVQQLQDLVYKLKDAVRHCDRISSVQ